MNEKELRAIVDKLNADKALEAQLHVSELFLDAQKLLAFTRAQKPSATVVRNYTTYAAYEEPITE